MPLTDLPTLGIQPLTPTFEITLLYNPSRRSAVNIVPGLLGVILTMTMILFTSAAIVRERERGNLELLITTPVHSIELMIGKSSRTFCWFDPSGDYSWFRAFYFCRSD